MLLARAAREPMDTQAKEPTMSWKMQPEAVVDKVLKRAEVSKIARTLQNRLALAQFKTKRGWEDLAFDTIAPKFEEEMRRKRLSENTADNLSDSSSSSTSESAPYPASAATTARTLMSSPLKAPLYSSLIGSSSGSTGHRKRTYHLASLDDDDDNPGSSPTKRFRSSPTPHKPFPAWRDAAVHHLTQSSPVKPRRHQHFTTLNGPHVSFSQSSRAASVDPLGSATNFAAPLSDDDDDLLPTHSFHVSAFAVRSSPPHTPPRRGRAPTDKNNREKLPKCGEEGADLLLYLAQSPSPAMPAGKISAMDPPSTPPAKSLALPSSMMTTPGGGNLFPNTPGQPFDFADFIKFTPSPRTFKTPVALSATTKTPITAARRRLTFGEPPA